MGKLRYVRDSHGCSPCSETSAPQADVTTTLVIHPQMRLPVDNGLQSESDLVRTCILGAMTKVCGCECAGWRVGS